MTHRRPRTPQRVLAALAVVLGVLAMHGVTSAHHGPTAALSAAAADVVGAGTAAAHAADLAADAVHGDSAHDCNGGCSDGAARMLLLCVAVLLTAGLAVAGTLAGRRWRLAPGTGPPRPAWPRRAAPVLRLDPVSDLCVSRT